MSRMHDRLYPQHGDVVATIDIAAPPERVFRALTNPEDLAEWWVGTESLILPGAHQWQVDPRPRGQWSVTSRDALGREATIRGEYRVVDPPRLLEFSWQASWDGVLTTTVRCELEPMIVSGVAGTRLRVTHTAARSAVAYAGMARPSFCWNEALESLRRHLASAPSRHASVRVPYRRGEIIA
jgi:uncharacterized protein YndB with AHSA1/START domain